ncbi:glycosyltransferase family 4 protein [Pseudooceanicola marinus]|uniref:glycosyltransferase family 4 protein n=1 Tax=Pseudooceanicola marinus TaxID=396013 RepID=UPI001CD20508|nr:glycosyltransferase family 4 protein [Pseudooceanicola marinus]MCA1338154.1 glycosyltransferase family 4 protein [Pseudooceanicola marinus]
MKVVLVTSVPAFPTTAGNRSRIRELARAVQELGHELTFVILPAELDQGDAAAHEAAFGAARGGRFVQLSNGGALGHLWYRVRRKARLGWRKALRLLGIEAGHYSALDQTWYAPWAAQLAELGRDADAVIVEYVFNSKVFDCFPATTRRILDTHDAFGERHKPYLAQGMTIGYWTSLRLSAENRGFRRADAILAIQQEEATRFAAQMAQEGKSEDNPEVAVVSHFLDIDAPVDDFSASETAMFLASNNPSNRQAIREFVANVLPLVVEKMPGFDLKLVGSICKEAPDGPNITKLGRVDDLREAFTLAPLSVNPMLVGTGINIKLLDAMAAGVATVSTETGLRGLPAEYRAGVEEVGDQDHAAFAAQILRLAGDETLRRQIGAAAHADALRWNAKQSAQLSRCLAG